MAEVDCRTTAASAVSSAPMIHDIGVAASLGDRARHALRRPIARYAPITGFVEPGERDGHWKAKYRGDDQRDHHPQWHTLGLERGVGDLQQQPGDDGVARRGADETSLAQAVQPGGVPADFVCLATCALQDTVSDSTLRKSGAGGQKSSVTIQLSEWRRILLMASQ